MKTFRSADSCLISKEKFRVYFSVICMYYIKLNEIKEKLGLIDQLFQKQIMLH
jgi:hypothetical protein